MPSTMSIIHPVVAEDSRIPHKLKGAFNGEHPGILLLRAREAKGFFDPAQFVAEVNKYLCSRELTPSFTVRELAKYEEGIEPITSHRLHECLAVLNVPVAQILYNMAPSPA